MLFFTSIKKTLVSQNPGFVEYFKMVFPQNARCARMLEFEENICISYRFKPHRSFIFLVLRFSLASEPNWPSPELFRRAALFSQDTEVFGVEYLKVELPSGSRIWGKSTRNLPQIHISKTSFHKILFVKKSIFEKNIRQIKHPYTHLPPNDSTR